MRITVAFAVCWTSGLSMSLEQGNWEIMLLALAAAVWAIGSLLATRSRRAAAVCIMILLCGSAYGYWQLSANQSSLPESGMIRLTGSIVSSVEMDGDRVSFHIQTKKGRLAEKLLVTVRLTEPEQQDESSRWRRGDAVRLEGELSMPAGSRNFGQFDYNAYLSHKGIHRIVTIDGMDNITVTRQKGWSIPKAHSYLDLYRTGLADRVAALFRDEQAGFMQGMLLGVRAELDDSLLDRFSRLGLTHVIAISGMHVAIVIGGWLWLLRMLKVTKETALLTAMLLIPAYVLLTGASPSVVRAGLMAMIGIFAIRKGWMKDALQILALSFILMTAWNPLYIYDVGFQLSFVVTAGLIRGVPIFRRVLPGKPNWLMNAIAVAIIAQSVSLPLTLHYFNQFSLLSAPANLVFVPVFSLIVLPLGYMALLLSYAYMPIGFGLAEAAGWCNELCFWLIGRLDAPGAASIVWPSPSIGEAALWYASLFTVLNAISRLTAEGSELFPRFRRIGKAMLICGSTAILILLLLSYGSGTRGSGGTIAFLDVGQGDSILILTPDNKTILIDGGGTVRFQKQGEEWRLRSDPYDVGKDLLVPLLKKRGIRQIDYMIATHADADHVGGLAAVAERFPVKRLLFNGTLKDSPIAVRLFQLAVERNIPLYAVTNGQMLLADEHTRLTFLSPMAQSGLRFEDEQNGSSVAFLMEMYDKRFLFTGDMDESAERQVLTQLQEIHSSSTNNKMAPVDLLKVAHHGSKTSTSDPWLDYWHPRMAVLSVGARNVYRHPSPIVLDRLAGREIPVFRTDKHGEIQIKVKEREKLQYRSKISISF